MYYFWANEAQAGPYTLNQVRAMWNSGQINGTTIYWQEGMTRWTPLSAVAHIIENPAPVREAPRVLETRRLREQPTLPAPAIPIALLNQWLQYAVFALALFAFFLPNVSMSLAFMGSESMSMFELLTNTSGNDVNESPSSNGQHPPANMWDNVSGEKDNAGGVICAVSLFLLLGHYLLTIVWGFFAFALKQTHDFLTFLWLCLAIQFPVMFLIGGQVFINGVKNQTSKDLAVHPFYAQIDHALLSSIKLQPGMVTWFLMALSLGALILLLAKRKL